MEAGGSEGMARGVRAERGAAAGGSSRGPARSASGGELGPRVLGVLEEFFGVARGGAFCDESVDLGGRGCAIPGVRVRFGRRLEDTCLFTGM